jgi:hypothetical protein
LVQVSCNSFDLIKSVASLAQSMASLVDLVAKLRKLVASPVDFQAGRRLGSGITEAFLDQGSAAQVVDPFG